MPKPPLSPKRRFLTAMLGETVDRVPVGNVVSVITVELMEIAQAWFPKAHLNSDVMAQLAAVSHEVLGYDTVMPIASVTQEASALGCEVDWGAPDLMPTVKTHPFAEMQELQLPERWIEAPAVQVVLDALEILRKAYGERVVVVGKVMGPWTLSYHMMGVEDFLISTLQEPERARESLEILKSVTIDFAVAQMRAGADIICLADHATGGMVSPYMYRDFLLPIHQEIVEEIGGPTVLHCCGDTTDRLRYFVETGVDCYHFESQVNVEEAVSTAAGEMTLIGNINNPEVLLAGTREQVAEACREAIEGGVQILSPECAVPLTTPIENLQTLVEVAEGHA